MIRTDVVILGGGISGLVLLYYLKKRFQDRIDVVLLEKEARVGGWIETFHEQGYVFEKGPRTVRTSAVTLLELVEDLGLQDLVMVNQDRSGLRYTVRDGKMQSLPSSWKHVLRHPMLEGVRTQLLQGMFGTLGLTEDVSVAQWGRMRFGQEVVDRFLAPMCLGIYAQDPEVLSFQMCFPFLHAFFETRRWDVRREKRSRWIESVRRRGSVWSLQGGLGTLVDALYDKLKESIHLGQHVCEVGPEQVRTQSKLFVTSRIFSTLASEFYGADFCPKGSMQLLHLGYDVASFPIRGFGVLNPPYGGEKLLGAVFDSNNFAHQSKASVTLMHTCGAPMEALEQFEKITQVSLKPCVIRQGRADRAIAQYPPHFQKRRDAFVQQHPYMTCLGSSFDGVSLEVLAKRAKELAYDDIDSIFKTNVSRHLDIAGEKMVGAKAGTGQ